MEVVVLALFVSILIGFILSGLPILAALLVGYGLFAGFALWKGVSLRRLLAVSFQGIQTVSTILITFLLIGVLTALWRASGTIPTIVCLSVKLIRPQLFPVLTFLLCCLISFLTGTAFGTAATMGAICVTISNALGLHPVWTAGAVLGGAYFGDRFSPVSTSALLVATVTKTELYHNLRAMLKSTAVPFLLTLVIYTAAGLLMSNRPGDLPDIQAIFAAEFNLGLVCVIPAAIIIVLALFRLRVRLVMAVSIVVSALICIFVQGLPLPRLLHVCVFGFVPNDPALHSMISGGGILSMVRVTAIVCISASYSGIFKETQLLHPMTRLIQAMARRCSAYSVVLLVSVVTGAVACNQTLSIMLTQQLCGDLEADNQKFALYLENSAVVVVPLLPWSVACSVCLASAGASPYGYLTAFFLMLLPLWSLYIYKKSDDV